jgi:methylated-DNA-protein-cysteine methyltransferase related protein
MASSEAFARIKSQVLQITASIPHGRITSFNAIAKHLDVMPRQVAFILSQLSDDEKRTLPWHRVTGESGKLGAIKTHADGRKQAQLLSDEDHSLENHERVLNFEQCFVDVKQLKHGLPLQTRPTDLPRATRPRTSS